MEHDLEMWRALFDEALLIHEEPGMKARRLRHMRRDLLRLPITRERIALTQRIEEVLEALETAA